MRTKLPRGDHGECDPPHAKGKAIRITSRTLSESSELDVLIHEALHACLWDIDHDAIDETAHDLTRLLLREGWRNK